MFQQYWYNCLNSDQFYGYLELKIRNRIIQYSFKIIAEFKNSVPFLIRKKATSPIELNQTKNLHEKYLLGFIQRFTAME